MALVLNDRVKETTTTTGTGALTLAGAVTGFETFGTGVGNSNTTYYAVTLPGTAEFEVGLGTLNSDSSTITRTTVISSSNSDNAVNFSAGTKTIFCTLPASKTVFLDGSGNATLGADLSVGDDLTVEGGVISFRSNSGSPASLRMYCEVSNAHFQTLQPQPHAASAANTLRLPNSGDSGTQDLVAVDITQTLTNKTLTSPKINEDVAVTSTATEINKLDGVTATTTELNYVDVTTLGTVEASKAVTADANGDVLFPDNEKLKFGTGGDLEIFHSSTTSAIIDSGTGDLKIGSDTNLLLTNAGLTETKAKFVSNGASELYHDNVKKFETTSDGATVTGDLLISNSDADAVADPTITLYRNSSSPAFDDEMGEIIFQGRNNNSENVNYGRIVGKIAQTTDGSEKGNIEFNIMENGTEATFVEMAFDNVFVNKQLTMFNNIFLDGNFSIIWDGATNNSNTTSLVVTDPTAVNTITLPDATGTVLTTGNSDTPSTTTSSSDADFVLVDDGGTMKKITPSNLGITSGGASKGFAVAMAIAL